jgi:hypothetical protein
MSLSTGRYQLANAFKVLKQEWEGTSNFWRDVVRKEFAEDHFEPLATRLSTVLTAIDRLDNALGQMRRDCGDNAYSE